MAIAGYLLNTPGGPVGERGTGYDYVLAGNGLFIEARVPLLAARVAVAWCNVRGLAPLEPYVRLANGPVPAVLLELAVNHMWSYPDEEMYLAIVWDGDGHRYSLKQPPQERSAIRVQYEVLPGTVLSLHSHGRMDPFFSHTDDQDEQGLLLSMVLGEVRPDMSGPPLARVRVCAYGYFSPVAAREVFDGYVPVREETSP